MEGNNGKEIIKKSQAFLIVVIMRLKKEKENGIGFWIQRIEICVE